MAAIRELPCRARVADGPENDRAIARAAQRGSVVLAFCGMAWWASAAEPATAAASFGAPTLGTVATPCAEAATPADVVSAVVKLDNGRDWAPVFAQKPTALMLRYFTAGFNASWANAMKHNQDEPVLDGDPITGGQGITSLVLRSVKTGPISGQSSSVVAVLSVRSEGTTKPVLQSVTFSMKREGATWKIDDMSGPVNGTLRTHFRKAYGT